MKELNILLREIKLANDYRVTFFVIANNDSITPYKTFVRFFSTPLTSIFIKASGISKEALAIKLSSELKADKQLVQMIERKNIAFDEQDIYALDITKGKSLFCTIIHASFEKEHIHFKLSFCFYVPFKNSVQLYDGFSEKYVSNDRTVKMELDCQKGDQTFGRFIGLDATFYDMDLTFLIQKGSYGFTFPNDNTQREVTLCIKRAFVKISNTKNDVPLSPQECLLFNLISDTLMARDFVNIDGFEKFIIELIRYLMANPILYRTWL